LKTVLLSLREGDKSEIRFENMAAHAEKICTCWLFLSEER